MVWGNLREMHGKVAAGKVLEAVVDEQGLYIKAQIVDDDVWAKVKAGVYLGFSVAGDTTGVQDRADGARIITGLDLAEISVVDRPANPQAKISVVKIRSLPLKIEKARIARRPDVNPDAKDRPDDIEYADETNKRYKLDTEAHVRAAAKYSAEDQKKIDAKIAAAKRKFGIGETNKTTKGNMLTFQETLALIADPAERALVQKAAAIIQKASGDTWGGDGPKEIDDKPENADVGLDGLGDHDDEEDIGEFLKATDADGDDDGDTKPDGQDGKDPENQDPDMKKAADGLKGTLDGCMGHAEKCHKALKACHKAFGEDGDHPAKAPFMKCAGHFMKVHKSLTKACKMAGESTEKARTSGKIEKGLQAQINELEKAIEMVATRFANELVEVHKVLGGLPRSRVAPDSDVTRFDRDSTTSLIRQTADALNGR